MPADPPSVTLPSVVVWRPSRYRQPDRTMRIRNILQPWVLVATGIALNIISALLVHLVVEGNMQSIDKLNEQIESVELRIDNAWQTKVRLERTEEFLLSLFLSTTPSTPSAAVTGFIAAELNQLEKHHAVSDEPVSETALSVLTIRQRIDRIQRMLLQSVDDIYLDKIHQRRLLHSLEESNQRGRSIALFLQLIGLIFVLARDLARSR